MLRCFHKTNNFRPIMFEIPEKKEVTKDLMPHVTSIFYDQRNYGQQLNCRLSLTAKARIKVEYSVRILKIPDSLIPDSRLPHSRLKTPHSRLTKRSGV